MKTSTAGNWWCDALEERLADAARERARLVESVLAGVGGQYGE